MMDPREWKKLNKQLTKIGTGLNRAARYNHFSWNTSLLAFGNNVRNRIIEGMTREAKHGRYYRRGKKLHRASAPGEYPASDTGEMVRSLAFDLRPMEVEVGVSGGAPYARVLEFGSNIMWSSMGRSGGTSGSRQIEPRPWLARSADQYTGELLNDFLRKTGYNIETAFRLGMRI